MGGYPVNGYRNASARAKHSMSSADSTTRLAQRLDELIFIGPRDFRTPPKEKWRPLHKGTVDLNRANIVRSRGRASVRWFCPLGTRTSSTQVEIGAMRTAQGYVQSI